MQRNILCLVLMLTIFLSIPGCNNNKEEISNDIPIYQETHIGQAVGLISPGDARLNSKGHLVVYDWGQSPPSFITIDTEGNPKDTLDCGTVGASVMFTIDANDTLYLLSQKKVIEQSSERHTGNEVTLKIFSPSGSLTKSIDLGIVPVNNEKKPSFINIAVDANGTIYLLTVDGSIKAIGPNGREMKTENEYKYSSLAIDGNNNLLVCGSSGDAGKPFIQKINPVNWRSAWKQNIENIPHTIRYNKEGEFIYVFTEKGLSIFNISGKLQHQLIFSKAGIHIDPTAISSINMDKDMNIYITTYDKPNITKYTLTKTQLQQEPVKKLSFWTTYGGDNGYILTNAKSRLIDSNIDVELNIFDDADRNLKDNLYTEILAGMGPDIIDVSILPYKKFIEKDRLVNLTEFVENDPDFDLGDYNENIINASRYDGKLYIMPVIVELNGLLGNNEILKNESIEIDDSRWTWNDFFMICDKGTKDTDKDGVIDQYALAKEDSKNLFTQSMAATHYQFIDFKSKACTFNSERFINLLTSFKDLINSNFNHPEIGRHETISNNANGEIAFVQIDLNSIDSLYYNQKRLGWKTAGFYKYPSNSDSSGTSCNPRLAVAINNNSKYVKESWEFIKALLSKEVLSSQPFPEITVNQAANELNKARILNVLSDNNSLDTNNLLAEIEKIETLINSCNQISYIDTKILSIIRTEANAFFQDEKSAEDTAKAIQQKVSTYLNE